jgi:hypothetical protein
VSERASDGIVTREIALGVAQRIRSAGVAARELSAVRKNEPHLHALVDGFLSGVRGRLRQTGAPPEVAIHLHRAAKILAARVLLALREADRKFGV